MVEVEQEGNFTSFFRLALVFITRTQIVLGRYVFEMWSCYVIRW